MTTPVPTRFSPEETKLLDELVAAGVGDTRPAVVRFAVIRPADAVPRSQGGAKKIVHPTHQVADAAFPLIDPASRSSL
jgi:methylmalonyl-CoA mutase cobalamin-binding subunit